ncbi:MAG: bifunctional phosphoribosylaminoimidazolecarboxamide formyltransferase/IMP cyclohydrolase [Acidimicrobiales bacterium]
MRIAVLASGSGTILDSIVGAGIPVAVVLVDRPCGAIDVAARHGVPAQLVERSSFGADFDRDAYSQHVADLLADHEIDLVVMAGWGTIFSAPMFDAFGGRIINTHPALLPAFKGWHAVADVGGRRQGDGVHRARRHRGGRPRTHPRPGGRRRPARRHGRLVARAHQGRGAPHLRGRHRRHHREGKRPVSSATALLSVYDKTGIAELAAELHALGVRLLSSGGTAKVIAEAGIPVTDVADVTGVPAILGHRVVTLHPKVHGGLLADRDDPAHLADMETYGIEGIDLVVVNLYPFSSDPSIELIDIGGPAMVRASAKNHAHVAVVTDPADYPTVLAELRADGAVSAGTRRALARKAFATTAAYDAQIVSWFDEDVELPDTIHLALEKVDELRYGENPHQPGARYREVGTTSWWDDVVQHSGLALSYLNLYDAAAAWELAHDLGDRPTVAIIKHANPCGVAVADSLADAYAKAFACDERSAFGGIVALNRPVDTATVEAMVDAAQADVVIAPGYEPGTLDALRAKRKNTRLLEAPPPATSA